MGMTNVACATNRAGGLKLKDVDILDQEGVTKDVIELQERCKKFRTKG